MLINKGKISERSEKTGDYYSDIGLGLLLASVFINFVLIFCLIYFNNHKMIHTLITQSKSFPYYFTLLYFIHIL